jgi:hypothetical protein
MHHELETIETMVIFKIYEPNINLKINMYNNTHYDTYFCKMFLELWRVNSDKGKIVMNYIIKNKSHCWNMLLDILKIVDYNLNIENFNTEYQQLYHYICEKMSEQFYEDWCNRRTSDSKFPINFDYGDYDDDLHYGKDPNSIYYNTQETWFFHWIICHYKYGLVTTENNTDYKNFSEIFLRKLENILKKKGIKTYFQIFKKKSIIKCIFKQMLIDISDSKLDKIQKKATEYNIDRRIIQKQERQKLSKSVYTNNIDHENPIRSLLYYIWYVARLNENKPNKDISPLMFLDMDVINKISLYCF